jgi:predicted ester cyclase
MLKRYNMFSIVNPAGIIAVIIVTLFTAGCSMSKEEHNKQIVREVYEKGINAHNIEYLDSVLADNYTRHSQSSPPGMQEITDKQTFLKFAKMHLSSFPDWNEKIEFMVAEGDKVAFLTIGTGTNTGKIGNIAPTGKNVSVQNLTVHRIDENNHIAETWILWDNLTILSQLGLYPPAGLEN